MPNKNGKRATRKSVHDDYELPDEVDFNRTKFIGFGLDALERHAGRKLTVQLDPDVARVFDSSESVNTLLRGVIESLSARSKKRRKSA